MSRYAVIVVCILGASALGEGSYDEARHDFDYDQKAPLSIQELKVEDRDGVRIHDLSYDSPKGGRVPAYLVQPRGKGPFPAVIYGHWCMPGSPKKNRSEFLPEAVVLANSGVISLLVDHVTVRSSFVEDSTPLNDQQIEVLVQQVVDVRRGADLLLARRDVDPKRLAYVGHSCDATVGGVVSGVDKRFEAFVIMAGELSDEVDLKSKAFHDYRQKVGPEKFDAFTQKYSWADPGKYVSHAAPATVFMQNATREPYLTPDIARQYFALVSEPKKLKIYHAEHALNAEATRDRISFLATQLSFKPPDVKSMGAIPELWQPEWRREQQPNQTNQQKGSESKTR